MQKVELTDYAMPLMNIERLAKQAHDLCLEKKYTEARLLAEKLCVEGRLLQHVLYLMDEQEQRRSNADTKEIQIGPEVHHRGNGAHPPQPSRRNGRI